VAPQAEEGHATGWWATVDAGKSTADEDAAKTKAGFTTQFGLTGQSGMGSSLFSIRELLPILLLLLLLLLSTSLVPCLLLLLPSFLRHQDSPPIFAVCLRQRPCKSLLVNGSSSAAAAQAGTRAQQGITARQSQHMMAACRHCHPARFFTSPAC
jgi:cytochrome c553